MMIRTLNSSAFEGEMPEKRDCRKVKQSMSAAKKNPTPVDGNELMSVNPRMANGLLTDNDAIADTLSYRV